MYSKIKSIFQSLGKVAIMAIVSMFITSASNAQEKKEVVVLKDSLYVFPEDIGNLTYSEAMKACEDVNSTKSYGYSDWRIPSLTELLMMYYYYSKIGGRREGPYLSNQRYRDGYRIVCLIDAFTLRGEKPSEYTIIRHATQGNIRLVRSNNKQCAKKESSK